MSQARSRSYFFGFSTAARTAPREQQNQPNFSWTDGVRFGEAKTPGPTWNNVVTGDRKGRKAGDQGRGLVNPAFAQRPQKEGKLTMKEQTRDVSWRSRAAGGTFVNKMYRPYPGPSRAPWYDCAFSSRKCEMPRKAPLSFCDCACHDHHGQAICRRVQYHAPGMGRKRCWYGEKSPRRSCPFDHLQPQRGRPSRSAEYQPFHASSTAPRQSWRTRPQPALDGWLRMTRSISHAGSRERRQAPEMNK